MKFTWSDKEDKELYRNGITIIWIEGRSKAIQKFVEVLSYKIDSKCDLDDSEVIQPGNNINDVDMTGELWILIEKNFELYETLKLKKVNSFCIDKEKDTTISNFEFDIIEKYI